MNIMLRHVTSVPRNDWRSANVQTDATKKSAAAFKVQSQGKWRPNDNCNVFILKVKHFFLCDGRTELKKPVFSFLYGKDGQVICGGHHFMPKKLRFYQMELKIYMKVPFFISACKKNYLWFPNKKLLGIFEYTIHFYWKTIISPMQRENKWKYEKI